MSHYPNPFDFVPFPAAPILRTEAEFDALGEKLSGYLELEIKALTPVHIVGKVEADPDQHYSFMYQQDGQPCIPASSIRGSLRAFTEALTAGWVSQATSEYEKIYGRFPDGGLNPRGRHIGFRTFEKYTPQRSSRGRTSPEAVRPAFKPEPSKDKLDVASYLFGFVAEDKQKDHDNQAWKSKVWVEDAYLTAASMTRKGYWMPDIAMGDAFMGGAKPNASNWWYFLPAEVWKRNLPYPTPPVAEFVGEHFRGRKFYYHQDPAVCIQAYNPDSDSSQWLYPENKYHEKVFHRVRLECVAPEKTSLPFRIYLDGVPKSLFRLLMRILLPGEHIRHKLGYAKAYGYGSIEFTLKSANLRTVGLGIPKALELWDVPAGNWDRATLAKYGLADLVDWEALRWLAQILGWPHEGLLFMYPQYLTLDPRTQKLKQPRPVQHAQFTQKLNEHGLRARDPMTVTSRDARTIAEALWELKQPIDFGLYQEKAEGWDKITKRTP